MHPKRAKNLNVVFVCKQCREWWGAKLNANISFVHLVWTAGANCRIYALCAKPITTKYGTCCVVGVLHGDIKTVFV
jgi:hypothetical protein